MKDKYIASKAFNKSEVFKGIDHSNSNNASDKTLQNGFNTAFLWSGIICVVVIVASGIMFVSAAGNPQTVSKAKNALTYSVVGLIVIILATAIVNLVINAISSGNV